MKHLKNVIKLMGVVAFVFYSSVAFAAEVNSTTKVIVEKPKPKPIPQYTISIVSPQPDETFQSSTQEFTVKVDIKPDLEKEDTVVILVDGSQSGEPISSTSITIPPLERGSHTIQAKIIQPKGKGAESNIVTMFQQRHSKLLP
jgi:hypothetical protein